VSLPKRKYERTCLCGGLVGAWGTAAPHIDSGQLKAQNLTPKSSRKVAHMSIHDTERLMDEAWAKLCQENGWTCKFCGAVPQRGQRFDNGVCDDCRLIVRSE